jgi:hypothetical protein
MSQTAHPQGSAIAVLKGDERLIIIIIIIIIIIYCKWVVTRWHEYVTFAVVLYCGSLVMLMKREYIPTVRLPGLCGTVREIWVRLG